MKEPVTIALLPYAQAEILKSLFESEGIECSLQNTNLIQGAVSSGVKIRISGDNLGKAYPILNRFMGEKDQPEMHYENTILIPVDFSDYSFKAALTGYEIACKLKSKLLLYHVMLQPDFFTVPYSEAMVFNSGLYEHLDEQEKLAHEHLRQFMEKLTGYVGSANWRQLQSEYMIKMGYPEDDILNFTEKHPPRLVVMGIKGPSQDRYSIMGSTTAGVIYKSQIPVLVIPEKAPLINLASMKKVVYATNFDDQDFISIDKLVGLLKPFNTKIDILHIGTDFPKEWINARMKNMEDKIQSQYPDISFQCVTIPGKDLLATLEDYIIENEVDVLSLTTHKRNMITRIFNPSVARRMVFHIKTPLLVFHS